MAKTNFILYKDYKEHIDLLSNEDAGQLFKAIFAYVEGRTETNFNNPMSKMAFSFIKAGLERDLEKYKDIVKRNKENGKKGGRPKNPSGKSNNPINPSGKSNNPNKPKKADSGSGSVSDSVNDNDKKEEKKKKTFNYHDTDWFDNKQVNDVFIEFLDNRLLVNKKLVNSELSITRLVNKIIEYTDDSKIDIIDYAIIKNNDILYTNDRHKKIPIIKTDKERAKEQLEGIKNDNKRR